MVVSVLSPRPTMDETELVSAIWEHLLTCQRPQSADAIAKAVGAEPAPVRAAVARLRHGGLVTDVGSGNGVGQPGQPRQYTGRRTLNAVAWARAVDLGINLNLLEKLAEFDTKDRRLALQLASEGEIERIKENEAAEKKAARDERRLRKAKSQVAATELAQIVSDMTRSLKEQRTKGAKDPLSRNALNILEKTVAEGQHMLDALQNSLLRG
jgi:hypothetical protein